MPLVTNCASYTAIEAQFVTVKRIKIVRNCSKSRKLKEDPKTGVRAYARTPVFGLSSVILRFTDTGYL